MPLYMELRLGTPFGLYKEHPFHHLLYWIKMKVFWCPHMPGSTVCVCVYIYIYRERVWIRGWLLVLVCKEDVYIYICVCVCVSYKRLFKTHGGCTGQSQITQDKIIFTLRWQVMTHVSQVGAEAQCFAGICICSSQKKIIGKLEIRSSNWDILYN